MATYRHIILVIFILIFILLVVIIPSFSRMIVLVLVFVIGTALCRACIFAVFVVPTDAAATRLIAAGLDGRVGLIVIVAFAALTVGLLPFIIGANFCRRVKVIALRVGVVPL